MNKFSPLLKLTTAALATASIISCDASFEAAVDENLLATPEVSPASLADGVNGVNGVNGINGENGLKRLDCNPIEVHFGYERLMGKIGEKNASSMVAQAIPPGTYDIYLYYQDDYHPDQANQPYEQWYLMGAYADLVYSDYPHTRSIEEYEYGSGMFRIIDEPTYDLHTDDTEDSTYFYDVYIDYPIAWLKAVHAYPTDAYNSIQVVGADFFPANEYCDYIWDDDYRYPPGGKGKDGKGKDGKGKDGKGRDVEVPAVTDISTDLEGTEDALAETQE